MEVPVWGLKHGTDDIKIACTFPDFHHILFSICYCMWALPTFSFIWFMVIVIIKDGGSQCVNQFYSNVNKSGNTAFFSITFEWFRGKSWNSACSIMILNPNFSQSFTSMTSFCDAQRPLLHILSVKVKNTPFSWAWLYKTFMINIDQTTPFCF